MHPSRCSGSERPPAPAECSRTEVAGGVDSEDRDRVLRGVPGEEDDEVGVKLPVDAVLVDQPLPRPVVGEFVLLEGVRIVGGIQQGEEGIVDGAAAWICKRAD